MICTPCTETRHDECTAAGRHWTYCDCQHQPGPAMPGSQDGQHEAPA